MEETFDFQDNAADAQSVQDILDAECLSYFEELGDEEIYSRKHCRGKQNDAQREALEAAADSIWQSLNILCQSDLKLLSLPYMDTEEKQNALKAAIHNRHVSLKSVLSFVRNKWPMYLDQKKQKDRNKRQKQEKVQKDLNSSAKPREDTRRATLAVTLGETPANEDLQPQIVTLPFLERLIDDVINKLGDPCFKVHRLKSCHIEVQSFEAPETSKNAKEHTVGGARTAGKAGHALDEIFAIQSPLSEWSHAGGYLLYVTSTESSAFWRPYVGESFLLIHRIPQHVAEILHGNLSTLCYWVASKPGRTLNFIRLWKIPDTEFGEGNDSDKQRLEILNSFLELVFCLAFKSLPLPTLQQFLGQDIEESSLRGLNVVSPLLQSLKLSPTERAEFRSWLRFSPSTETLEFMHYRKAQLKEPSLKPSSTHPSYEEIRNAFICAIPPSTSCPFMNNEADICQPSQESESLSGTKGVVASYLKQEHVLDTLWNLPSGSTHARIGFVLDFDIHSARSTQESPPILPPALVSLGFSVDNCLVWPFNFQLTHIPRRFSRASPHNADLQKINRQIIDSSALQVIILCGPNAQNVAILPDSFEQVKLQIRNIFIEVFLEMEEKGYSDKTIRRVYLRLPTFLSTIHSSDWKMSAKIALIIKTAACLTHTENISAYYFNSRSVLSEIVLMRLQEEEGKGKNDT
ncbi:hypothetical protein N7528_006116 [Penicillium herquei]|nr:hypothetical protein N7528_006116 [Penicillium herquei]